MDSPMVKKLARLISITIIMVLLYGCDVINTLVDGFKNTKTNTNEVPYRPDDQWPIRFECDLEFYYPHAQVKTVTIQSGEVEVNNDYFCLDCVGGDYTWESAFDTQYRTMEWYGNDAGDTLVFETTFSGDITGATYFTFHKYNREMVVTVYCNIVLNKPDLVYEKKEFLIERIPYLEYWPADNFDEFYLEGQAVCNALVGFDYSKQDSWNIKTLEDVNCAGEPYVEAFVRAYFE